MPAAPEMPAAWEERAAVSEAEVAALREQLAALEQQLAAVTRQQAALRAALAELAGRPAGTATAETDPALRQCARDIVRVLREVGRPLTALEILEELAARHLGWRESAVRHALADLTTDGVLAEGNGNRPRCYTLVERP